VRTLAVDPEALPAAVTPLLAVAAVAERDVHVSVAPGVLDDALRPFCEAWCGEGRLVAGSARLQVSAVFAAAARYRELEALLVRR
jgi:hypothetical protein